MDRFVYSHQFFGHKFAYKFCGLGWPVRVVSASYKELARDVFSTLCLPHAALVALWYSRRASIGLL